MPHFLSTKTTKCVVKSHVGRSQLGSGPEDQQPVLTDVTPLNST